MNAIYKLILTVSLSSLAMAAFADADFSGTYSCNGNDPNSTPPAFKENIIFKKTGSTYSVQLIHSGSVFPYNLGTGVVNKDIPNAIAYVYWDPKSPTTMGSEIFIVNSDGSLDGVYADSNKTKSGTETCTKSAS